MSDQAALSVVLLAYGGPGSTDDVEPFLRRIMRPAEPTAEMVARAVGRYAAIGGSSPLVANTIVQRDALRGYLAGAAALDVSRAFGGRAVRAEVFVGMRHTAPSAADAVHEALAWGGGRAVAVIMASHQSERATGGYRDDVERAVAERAVTTRSTEDRAHVAFVGSWHADPGYLDAVADRVREALAELTGGESGIPAGSSGGQPPTVIFSAHSLPMVGGKGDPEYEQGLRETARGVMARLGELRWRLAYQSRSGRPGSEWLGPAVEDVLAEEAARRISGVVVVPLGFVVEHLETLYDLDIALRAEAGRLGLRMSRASTVRDHPAFIAALAGAVVRTVREAGWSADRGKENDGRRN